MKDGLSYEINESNKVKIADGLGRMLFCEKNHEKPDGENWFDDILSLSRVGKYGDYSIRLEWYFCFYGKKVLLPSL